MKPWLKIILPILFILLSNAQSLWAQKKDLPAELSVSGIGDFKLVHGGTYQMGNAVPVHTISLTQYYIMTTEVTQTTWQTIMRTSPSSHNCPDCPVEQVSFDDVKEFVAKLNERQGNPVISNFEFRLPTEAEWEIAAKGGGNKKTYKYSGSDVAAAVGLPYDSKVQHSHSAKKKAANSLGLYDMSGNVAEWVLDNYVPYSHYAGRKTPNPYFANASPDYVVRGGSFADGDTAWTVYARKKVDGNGNKSIGFRLVFASRIVNGAVEVITDKGTSDTKPAPKPVVTPEQIENQLAEAEKEEAAAKMAGETAETTLQAALDNNKAYDNALKNNQNPPLALPDLNKQTDKAIDAGNRAKGQLTENRKEKEKIRTNIRNNPTIVPDANAKILDLTKDITALQLEINKLNRLINELIKEKTDNLMLRLEFIEKEKKRLEQQQTIEKNKVVPIPPTTTDETENVTLPASTLKKKGTVYVATYKNTEFNFVMVKGGTFTMGCTNEMGECYPDEKPTHQVTLNSFYLGQTEVTQKQYRAIMNKNPSTSTICDDCPVETVSYEEADEFISNLNLLEKKELYYLPTEAEWEFAARGGNSPNNTMYSGSNTLNNVGWYDGNSDNKTHEVAQKLPNSLGLYDMSGNVWEWCKDWYGTYPGSAQTNTQGPNSGGYRVYRGGSWDDNARNCRVSNRFYYTPSDRLRYIGFRLLRAVTP